MKKNSNEKTRKPERLTADELARVIGGSCKKLGLGTSPGISG